MEESRILIALAEYKAKYAWDKSLITLATTPPEAPEPHSNTALEDFIRASQARAQQDQG